MRVISPRSTSVSQICPPMRSASTWAARTSIFTPMRGAWLTIQARSSPRRGAPCSSIRPPRSLTASASRLSSAGGLVMSRDGRSSTSASADPSGRSRTSASSRSAAAVDRPAALSGWRSTARWTPNMLIVPASSRARSIAASSGVAPGMISIRSVASTSVANSRSAASRPNPSSPWTSRSGALTRRPPRRPAGGSPARRSAARRPRPGRPPGRARGAERPRSAPRTRDAAASCRPAARRRS